MLQEVNALLPNVERLTAGTEFQADALSKGRSSIELARKALESPSLEAINAALDQLSRTHNLFRGVVQRIGSHV